MGRVILHCDCNSFFASVEEALNPALKGVPMAVCGSVEARHGIVLAKNELAKKYNIKTAETVYSAKRKCPNLVITEPHYDLYQEYSERVNEIYKRYTDMVEPFGIDESWLDVTASGKFFGTGEQIAHEIRTAVKKEIGITISVGVSFNKVFAKLGSDYKKPDAVTVIDEKNFKSIVYPLPVGALLFVGAKTEEVLHRIGIKTVSELASATPALLTSRLGRVGDMLQKYAKGLDDSPVLSVPDEVKSVGNGFTFKQDIVSFEQAQVGINYLCEHIGTRLRKKGMKCSTVVLTIKNEFLTSIQRQRPQSPPTDISREIAATAYAILREEWYEGNPIRMLTVTAANLCRADRVVEQLDFFDTGSEKKRSKVKKREQTVDKIRQKYGSDSILSGSSMSGELGLHEQKQGEVSVGHSESSSDDDKR